ncbi:MAG TPA: RNA 2',3'-cyclic phosphodiesterase [Anaerovoracaceae bacterium]|nr:RNA 2',3'-cyclic phosphodiesterase [Anaerovoracaceae bacterium]
MRLFIAINLSDEIKDYLTAAICELKNHASKGNFTRRENLHLTLVFLGELSADQPSAVKSAMNRVNGEPFRLSFSGFGRFKRNGRDIHWVGVEKSEALFSIQKQLSVELEKAGFSLEDRAYSPHLTLGREVRLTDPSVNIYGSLPAVKAEMDATRISLMKSERVNGILAYTEIYGKDLGK